MQELINEYDNQKCDVGVIEFFAKKQNKFMLSNEDEEWYEKDKNSLGVSAWSKCCNAIFSAWARAFEEKFIENLKDNIIYGCSESEEVFGARMAAFINAAKNDKISMETLCNDFKEFDSSQNSGSIEHECAILASEKL
jgi:hypothetical protein